MDAIAFSLVLFSVAAWLIGVALRDARASWTFIRELPAVDSSGPADSSSPFRVGEPSREPQSFDDGGERRALTIARASSIAALGLAVLIARWMVEDLPSDARWIVVSWAFVIGGAMVHDQLCRQWWVALFGIPALFFAFLIDPIHWPWMVAIWVVHLGLRMAVELRSRFARPR